MILWFCDLTACAAQVAQTRAQHRLGTAFGRGIAAVRDPQVLTGQVLDRILDKGTGESKEVLSQISVVSMDNFQLWNLAMVFNVFCLWGMQTALSLSPSICSHSHYKLGESFKPGS